MKVMADAAPKVALDPVGSLFSAAWKRCEERFWVLIQICILPGAVIFLGDMLMARPGTPSAIFGMILSLVGIFLSVAATIALISAVGRDTDFGSSYETGVKLFWSAFLVSILNSLAIFGGFTLLFIPGFIVMVWLAFSNYALVLDGKRGMGALLASRGFTKGYWWGILGRGFALVMGFVAVLLIIYVPILLFLGPIAAGIVYALILLVFVPFSQCYVFELYENLRRVQQPANAEDTKATKIFLTVLMIVAVLAAVAISVVAALFGNNVPPGGYNGYPGYPGYPGGFPYGNTSSTVTSAEVVPSQGGQGTVVTITLPSSILSSTGNKVLMGGLLAAGDLASADGKSLKFTVPSHLGPNCDPHMACPQFLVLIRAGLYPVSVLLGNSPSGSTGVPVGDFTVTGGTSTGSGPSSAEPLY